MHLGNALLAVEANGRSVKYKVSPAEDVGRYKKVDETIDPSPALGEIYRKKEPPESSDGFQALLEFLARKRIRRP